MPYDFTLVHFLWNLALLAFLLLFRLSYLFCSNYAVDQNTSVLTPPNCVKSRSGRRLIVEPSTNQKIILLPHYFSSKKSDWRWIVQEDAVWPSCKPTLDHGVDHWRTTYHVSSQTASGLLFMKHSVKNHSKS